MKQTGELFDQEPELRSQEPVTCLGITFPDDNARREHFLRLLKDKLQNPEFREIEGFPIGSDEDILTLSDPPYYTACPNPWIADFIKHYGTPYDPSLSYSREPFAADVSEGKNDPIYNAHSYHTKVPHKAIMRYILHYTEPGDIVFDGFCGTGMTGVAAQMCGNKAVVESLGYRVDNDGTILQQETDENERAQWKPFSKLGARRAVLNDLSPVATFIAYNYNTPVDVQAFEREAKRILKEVEDECGWMYETLHTDGKTKGKINYTVWSDVFICPECTGEVIFWEAALDKTSGIVRDEFPCPHCGATLSKRSMERSWVNKYDSAINQTNRQAKQVPVLINYTAAGKRAEKTPNAFDLALIDRIDNSDIPYWFPTKAIPKGDKTGEPLRIGITHVHHFYTRSGLFLLAKYWDSCGTDRVAVACRLAHTAASSYVSKMRRYRADKKGGGPLAGTLYIASLITPPHPIKTIARNAQDISNAFHTILSMTDYCFIESQSTTNTCTIPSDSIEYIFIDPPFGSNLNYSELNFLWESWLKVQTNNKSEAIENKTQGKGPNEYRHLMTVCFKEAYRVLKPGRWMTVEFSNTKASVWNSIQTALTEAGFIVANVSALDKQQGSFNSVTNTTSVKQDLIISAYKPNGGFEDRFQKEAATEEGVWDFVRTHLKYLPVVKRGTSTHLIAVTERDPRILYDQMVAYFVRKGYPVPLNSAEFQAGLTQRYSYRDGMYFLPDQVAEYDKKKMTSGGVEQMSLFVSDESSAIAWLRQLLKDKPQTFQDIHPMFIKELGGWLKHEKSLELSQLLDDTFICYDGKGEVPNQIHSYLSTNFKELRNLPKDDESLRAKGKDRWFVPDPNKAGDMEKKRERSLLKEFEEYRALTQKRLKVFRLEAVRTGFKKAWQERDYTTIITVARKIPETILQEDPKLLMWYDQALTRTGDIQ
jgi:DNA modification methylase